MNYRGIPVKSIGLCYDLSVLIHILTISPRSFGSSWRISLDKSSEQYTWDLSLQKKYNCNNVTRTRTTSELFTVHNNLRSSLTLSFLLFLPEGSKIKIALIYLLII